MDTSNNVVKKNNKYIFMFFIAIVILIIVIVIIYYVINNRPTQVISTITDGVPLSDEVQRLLNLATANVGKNFIFSTPNDTLYLTYIGSNALNQLLLTNTFTIMTSPFSIKFNYNDTFSPPITLTTGSTYTIYYADQNPITDVFNFTALGIVSRTGYACIAFEQANSCT